MTKTKHTAGEFCISQTKHRSSTMLILSASLTILSLICGCNSATLPVKTFPAFSPQTIARFSHKSPVNVLSNNNHSPNNGQKESELAMNLVEVFPKQTELEMSMGYPYDEAVFDSDSESIQLDNEEETVQLQELAKRALNKWQGLQGGWGKRAPNNWNKLSAAWGKRRIPSNAAWNNLSGMWGKKRAKWNELSGMWGKRAAWRDMSGGWGKKKRSNAPHWNKLRGMWGKRSTIPFDDVENRQFSEDQQTMVQQFDSQQEQPAYSFAQSNSEQFQQSPVSEIVNNSKKDH